MNPPIKWRVSFEVKISILVMCIKAITQLWKLVLAYSATQQVNQTAIFITMSSNFLTMCISCQQQVRPRQEGLQCDDCLRWQHRTCSTGVLQSEYRDAVKTGAPIHWRCSTCDAPQSEITALSEISPDADVDFDSEQSSDQGNFCS